MNACSIEMQLRGARALIFPSRGGILPAGQPMQILSDYYWQEGDANFGVFAFASGGQLAGLEVYSLDGLRNASTLPPVEKLLPFPRGQQNHRCRVACPTLRLGAGYSRRPCLQRSPKPSLRHTSNGVAREPVWELAAIMYPPQGEWTEEDYLALDAKLALASSSFATAIWRYCPCPTPIISES